MAADPAEDADALIAELRRELSGSAYRRMVAWEHNLLKIAARNRLSVRVLALLLDDCRLSPRRFGMNARYFDDRAALIYACLYLPGAEQSEFLLANVKRSKQRGSDFPLLVLLAATQSHDDQWACRVLHSSNDIVFAVRSTVIVELVSFLGRSHGRDILLDVVREAVHSGMRGLLCELIALNRPAVVVAASEWLNLWEGVRLIVLVRRRLAHGVPVVKEYKPWERFISRMRRTDAKAVEAAVVAPHPILKLPGHVFATVVAFVLTPPGRSV